MGVGDGVGVAAGVGLGVGAAVAAGVGLGVGAAVAVGVGLGVAADVGVGLGVAAGLAVGVPVGVGLGASAVATGVGSGWSSEVHAAASIATASATARASSEPVLIALTVTIAPMIRFSPPALPEDDDTSSYVERAVAPSGPAAASSQLAGVRAGRRRRYRARALKPVCCACWISSSVMHSQSLALSAAIVASTAGSVVAGSEARALISAG